MTQLIFLACLALAQAEKASLDQLAWLAGCWESQQGARRTEEQWMKPAGGSMLGMSRTVAGEKTVMTETLLVRIEDQAPVLTVSLGIGGKPTAFKAIKFTSEEAVFENLAHDFPQRIIYRRQPDGSLFARIEGEEKGKARGINFPMTCCALR